MAEFSGDGSIMIAVDPLAKLLQTRPFPLPCEFGLTEKNREKVPLETIGKFCYIPQHHL